MRREGTTGGGGEVEGYKRERRGGGNGEEYRKEIQSSTQKTPPLGYIDVDETWTLVAHPPGQGLIAPYPLGHWWPTHLDRASAPKPYQPGHWLPDR